MRSGLFVVATSALFLAATTASVLRSTRSHGLDILVICLGTFAFIAFADDLALAPGIACFVAAAVTAGLGYVLRERGALLQDVGLYAGAAAVLILTGTAYLFSGVTLALIFTLEALLALTLATHLRLPGPVVMVISSAYVLPLAPQVRSFPIRLGNRCTQRSRWYAHGSRGGTLLVNVVAS